MMRPIYSLYLILLTSCAAFEGIPADEQAAVDCVIDAVSMSGREISLFVTQRDGPLVSVSGPATDTAEAEEWLILHAGQQDAEGRTGLSGYTDWDLQRQIVSQCGLRLWVVMAGNSQKGSLGGG